jgi:transcription antitermination factor NusB
VSKFTRHEIREIALTILYNAECEARSALPAAALLSDPTLPPEVSADESDSQNDQSGQNDQNGDLDQLCGNLDEAFGLAQSKEAKRLVLGILSHTKEFDSIIARLSPTRQVARIPLMLRAILRMALYEICYADTTPDKVAINEAIELAKEYGTGSDSSFVSGLLGNFYRERQSESTAATAE